jgi:hypothetical protein
VRFTLRAIVVGNDADKLAEYGADNFATRGWLVGSSRKDKAVPPRAWSPPASSPLLSDERSTGGSLLPSRTLGDKTRMPRPLFCRRNSWNLSHCQILMAALVRDFAKIFSEQSGYAPNSTREPCQKRGKQRLSRVDGPLSVNLNEERHEDLPLSALKTQISTGQRNLPIT